MPNDLQTEETVQIEPTFWMWGKKKMFKKIRPGFRRKMALLAVIERKRFSKNCDYKAIGKRHHCSEGTLRLLYWQWKAGGVDMGDPETPQERELNAREQHEKLLGLLQRYKAVVMHDFEGLLLRSEDAVTRGHGKAWKKLGMPEVMREIKAISDIQTNQEKGYMAILDELMAQRTRSEKQIGSTPADTSQKVISANEEERGLAALRDSIEVTVEQTNGELHPEASESVPR